jgi:hypothetical protein
MTWNSEFGYLEALDCIKYRKFVDQVTGNARNGHIGYGWLFMVQMTLNSGFGLLEALEWT